MINIIAALCITLLVSETLWRLGRSPHITMILSISKRATKVMRLKKASDHWKEIFFQAISLLCFKHTLMITFYFVLIIAIIAASVGVVYLFGQNHISYLQEWYNIAWTCCLGIVYIILRKSIGTKEI